MNDFVQPVVLFACSSTDRILPPRVCFFCFSQSHLLLTGCEVSIATSVGRSQTALLQLLSSQSGVLL